MIFYLGIPLSLCLWLILFGVYERMNQITDLTTPSTRLSFASKNSTVILIVLDAFRYDYTNKFKFTQQILQAHPQNSILLKMIVSAPTMTTQKIQVMMSGHQITYKSIIQNFVASKSTDDNIVKHVKSISIGDDTWSRLYQHQKSINCQSFIVSDLHTCDKMVINNLIKQYKTGDYQLLIGHFLGLDHIGHTFSSISTVQTNYKLNEISQFLNRVVEEMDNDTVLFVVGDHGMKSDGNHGGSSKEEIETILFAYSKGHKLMNREPKHLCFQGDITATLSMLLNCPLPNNSLGGIIYSALPDYFENRIDESTELLKSHIGRVLKRIGVEYEENQEIEIAGTVKAQIRDQYILFTIIVVLLTAIYLIIHINLNIFEIVFLCIYPLTNFSWLLLKNQQSYLQILLLIFFFIVTVKHQKPIVFIDSIVTIFLLCQFQPHRKDQYKNSLFHLDFISNFLQNPIVLLLIKLAYFISKTNWKISLNLQFLSNILMVVNIVMYEVSEEVLCYVRLLQLGLVILMVVKKQPSKNVMHYAILIFSGKKGLLMLGISNTLKLNLELAGSYVPYLAYYISEAIWLGEGNRADFSSIEIKSSYIFSPTFIPHLNFLCLVLNQMCSYIHFLQQLPLTIKINHLYSQIQQSQQSDVSKSSVCYIDGVDTHLKYLLVPLVGALFSLMGLYMNVGKILFTVVYVPLSFFCILKMITLYLFVIGRYAVMRLKIKMDNKIE